MADRSPRFARMIWRPFPSKPSSSAIPKWTGTPSTTSSTAARIKPERTTATWDGWPCCSQDFPKEVSGVTVNRLCGSSMDAVATAARAIKCGEGELIIAGGVESMSRAPFVVGKADAAFSRAMKLEDTTIGWRFINPLMKAKYGVDSMPETAEIVAEEFHVSREDQDAFALRSQQRAAAAIRNGFLAEEMVSVPIPQKKGDPVLVSADEHPRGDTSLAALAKLPGIVKPGGTVTAGNASGVNDGACALLLASESAAKRHELTPKARIITAAAAGVAPRIMGMGPAPASRKALCEGEFDHRPDGRHRTERSLRVTGVSSTARTWRRRRCRSRKSQRWRDRSGPSAWAPAVRA